jgi:hypothetical protein
MQPAKTSHRPMIKFKNPIRIQRVKKSSIRMIMEKKVVEVRLIGLVLKGLGARGCPPCTAFISLSF